MAKLTTEKFKKKTQETHGGMYDYSKVDYVNNQSPVEIICPVHGVFVQRPNNHLNDNGCPKCSRATQSAKQTMSQNIWLERVKRIHGNKYGYSKLKYTNNHTPNIVTCPVHVDFTQTPANHLKEQGCSVCGKNKAFLTGEARKPISEKLSSLPYEIVGPFSYVDDRDTQVTLHCNTQDYTWTTSWHQIIFAGTSLSGDSPGFRATYSKEV